MTPGHSRRHPRRRPGPIALLTLALALGLSLAGCRGGMETPEQTLETLRSATAAGDGATFYSGLESETQAYLKDSLRVWKARLERGDQDPEFLGSLPLEPAAIRDGDLDELAILWLTLDNPLGRHADWFDQATVTPGGESPSERERSLLLRGRDGSERVMWFLFENDRWSLDYLRTEWLH